MLSITVWFAYRWNIIDVKGTITVRLMFPNTVTFGFGFVIFMFLILFWDKISDLSYLGLLFRDRESDYLEGKNGDDYFERQKLPSTIFILKRDYDLFL